MPKMKSNRGASKRFRLSSSGNVRRQKAGKSHILTKKSTKRKRNLRKIGLVAAQDTNKVKQMISV